MFLSDAHARADASTLADGNPLVGPGMYDLPRWNEWENDIAGKIACLKIIPCLSAVEPLYIDYPND